jgi:chromosome partitioning protein
VPVIAVINRKGGSGKSTLATHIAASFARAGHHVMLGDVDRQQSSRAWLRRRSKLDPAQAPQILGWVVDKTSIARPPAGVSHLILDTPGGLTGFDLARLVMWCDAIVIPVCDSAFDRESAADCHVELGKLPRVANGRCRVAAVGMRIDRRTRGHAAIETWAAERGLHFLGSLRDTQTYVSCADRGLTVFDLPPQKAAPDLEEWAPVLEWLNEVVPAVVAPPRPTASRASASERSAAANRSRAASLSVPPTIDADVSQLMLTGVSKPGLWGFLRRLWSA